MLSLPCLQSLVLSNSHLSNPTQSQYVFFIFISIFKYIYQSILNTPLGYVPSNRTVIVDNEPTFLCFTLLFVLAPVKFRNSTSHLSSEGIVLKFLSCGTFTSFLISTQMFDFSSFYLLVHEEVVHLSVHFKMYLLFLCTCVCVCVYEK